MTTIAAVQLENDVVFAWDSQATRDNEIVLMKESKVWCKGGIVFAVSGSLRIADVLYTTKFPEYDGSDARTWLIKKFVPRIRRAIARTGQYDVLISEDGSLNAGLLVVVDGTLFSFDSLLSPISSTTGVYAMGSGGDYAIGAIYAGASVEDAVAIAADLDPFSRAPIHCASACEMIIAEED